MSVKKKVVLLLSWGIDSTTLLYEYYKNYDITGLFIDYGQTNHKEIESVEYHCEKLGIEYYVHKIDMGSLGCESSLVWGVIDSPTVHNRNMMFIAAALAFARNNNKDIVMIWSHLGSPDTDNSVEFIGRMDLVGKISVWIEVQAPYIYITKNEIIRKAQKLLDLNETRSCYEWWAGPCGKCKACKARLLALKE